MVLDVPEGSLEREATRLLVTVDGFGGTVFELNALSSQLRAHIANLGQFGLDEQVADSLLEARGTVEVISAIAIDDGTTSLSDAHLAEVREALGTIARTVGPLAEKAHGH